MIRQHIHFGEGQHKWLKAEAKRNGVKIAEIVRRAVELLRNQTKGAK